MNLCAGLRSLDRTHFALYDILEMQQAGPTSPARRFPTAGYAGYNVAWSPFFPDKFAVAGAANVRTFSG